MTTSPVTVEPYETLMLTLIFGYSNICSPCPTDSKFTYLPLS